MIRCKWCNLKNEKHIEYHNKECFIIKKTKARNYNI